MFPQTFTYITSDNLVVKKNRIQIISLTLRNKVSCDRMCDASGTPSAMSRRPKLPDEMLSFSPRPTTRLDSTQIICLVFVLVPITMI